MYDKKLRPIITCCMLLMSTTNSFTLDIAQLFPDHVIIPVIQKNRHVLSMVPTWVKDEDYASAFYWYGLPEHVRHLIDKPIGNEPTYSDVIVALKRFLKKPVSYLELGVSVGKNFYQIMNAATDSVLTGFDIENINPIFSSFLERKKIMGEFTTPTDSLKKNNSSMTHYYYAPTNNVVRYLSADIFDNNAWRYLAGEKFNLIFSDAFHTPEGLLQEHAMLDKFDLLDHDEFIIVWDDLGGLMSDTFMKIFTMLQKKFHLPDSAKMMIDVRGWLGINEPYHRVGIIMNVKNVF